MKMTPKSHTQLRLQNGLFYILFVAIIGLLGYLSTQYHVTADWTHGKRNSLSPATQTLLQKLDQPIKVVAYIPDNSPIKNSLKELFDKYRQFKQELTLEFVDPTLQPKRVQQDGVQYAGQIAIHYGDRHELIESTSEQTIVETLQRLSQTGERFVLFLEGHNERSPYGGESTAMGKLGDVLQRKGFNIQTHNLVRSPAIPQNTSFLVIASPQKPLLEGEVKVIRDYVAQGGNLLWLHEPGAMQGLEPLEAELGISIFNGTMVDANQELQFLLGINSPAVIPVVDYGLSPLTQGLNSSPSLFPFATAIVQDDTEQAELWEFDPFLNSLPSSWLEAGDLSGEVTFNADQDDQPGPLPIGVALTRMIDVDANEGDTAANNKQQRVVVIGDSDFMLNDFIGHGANLDLANNIFNWLNQNDDFIEVSLQSAPDTRLELSATLNNMIGLFFLLILPIGLLLSGFWVWWQRRKQ